MEPRSGGGEERIDWWLDIIKRNPESASNFVFVWAACRSWTASSRGKITQNRITRGSQCLVGLTPFFFLPCIAIVVPDSEDAIKPTACSVCRFA